MNASYDWQNALSSSYEQLTSYVIAHVPQLIGAILLIAIGWIVAWVLSKLTLTIFRFLGRIWDKTTQKFARSDVAVFKTSHSVIISKVVFWVVMLFFIAAAASSLGLDFFATWLSAFLAYIPQLFAGLVILVGGYLLANIAGAMAYSTSETAGFGQPTLISNLTRIAIMFTALVIGVEQLGINIQFITTLFIVVSGVLVFGLALAFGLGSKALVANIIGSKQIRKHVNLNDQVRIGASEGRIIDITSTMLVLETEHGREVYPAQVCMQAETRLILINSSATATEIGSKPK